METAAQRFIPWMAGVRSAPLFFQNRVIMNLPSDGMSFLPAAVQALGEEGGVVHYYAFAKRDENLASIEDAVRSLIENQGRSVGAFPYGGVIKEVAPSRVQVAMDILVKQQLKFSCHSHSHCRSWGTQSLNQIPVNIAGRFVCPYHQRPVRNE